MKKTVLVMLVLICVSLFVSCGEAKPKEAEIVYAEWARAVAITHVAEVIMEEYMGYTVNTTSAAAPVMWNAVGTGDADALLCGWLPITHKDFKAKNIKGLEDLGPNYTGAKLGIVVPQYVDIDSIPQMAENAEKFENKITGIEPGAGMMKQIDDAIEKDTSGLGVFENVASSETTMLSALEDAIKNEKWIAVPGWQPHWMFGQWKLKILNDPDQIFGAAETINTIVRKDLKKDDKDAYKFFKDFDWTAFNLATVMLDNKRGMEPQKSAAKFVKANEKAIKDQLKALDLLKK